MVNTDWPLDLGFETIGNATVIAYDRKPILATDPWLGEPAYFGSWGPQFDVPQQQCDAIQAAEYIWFSHGHPDHLNIGSLERISGSKILLPDHVGNRIRDDLLGMGLDVQVLPDGVEVALSDRIRVTCISDTFQDAIMLLRIGDSLVVNVNDAADSGWARRVRKTAQAARRSFLLKLVGQSDDELNFFDDQGNSLIAHSVRQGAFGPQLMFYARLFGVSDIVPFSCFHRYQRTDSLWANQHAVPLAAFNDRFDESVARLHPAFIRYDAMSDRTTQLNPPPITSPALPPETFGDDWSEATDAADETAIRNYFTAIESLRDGVDFIELKIGDRQFSVDLATRNFNRGICFEAPRGSFMAAIEHEIFDDLLLANFMKTTLIGDWKTRSLHPHFTPYVAKYADNGRAKSKRELANYMASYRRRAPMRFLLNAVEKESERRMRLLIGNNRRALDFARRTYLFLKT